VADAAWPEAGRLRRVIAAGVQHDEADCTEYDAGHGRDDEQHAALARRLAVCTTQEPRELHFWSNLSRNGRTFRTEVVHYNSILYVRFQVLGVLPNASAPRSDGARAGRDGWLVRHPWPLVRP